jgi:hypothetical protein
MREQEKLFVVESIGTYARWALQGCALTKGWVAGTE